MDLIIMNLDNSKKSDNEYLVYFENKWDCFKFVKLFNQL